jgi:5'-nucleotidase
MSADILLTNDDGIDAPGIAVLRHALEGLGTVTTIAPACNSSGVARSITIDRPLHVWPVTFGEGWAGFSCDGTPADCVRVGFLGLHGALPDLVVSGVNLGPNLGADVTYSGTVGAAFEAALRGRPGIAFSVNSRQPGWLAQAAPVLRRVVETVLARGLPPSAILNVNLPDAPFSEIAGIRPARLGGASCHDVVFLTGDGDGHVPLAVPSAGGTGDPLGPSAYMPGRCDCGVPEAAIDFDVVAGGYVAITPLRYALLDTAFLCELDSWDLDLEHLHA